MNVRDLTVGCVATLCLHTAGTAWAGPDTTKVTFTPPSGYSDFNDLDHLYAYTWGIKYEIPEGKMICGAKLIFDDIRNWDNKAHVLHVNLLDDPNISFGGKTNKVVEHYDNPNDNDFSNYFASKYSASEFELLAALTNLPYKNGEQDVVLEFTADQLALLNEWVSDGKFGFGLDPDCHFYNDGVKFEIELCDIPPPPPPGNPPGNGVPEPVSAAMGMLALGGLSYALRRRR